LTTIFPEYIEIIKYFFEKERNLRKINLNSTTIFNFGLEKAEKKYIKDFLRKNKITNTTSGNNKLTDEKLILQYIKTLNTHIPSKYPTITTPSILHIDDSYWYLEYDPEKQYGLELTFKKFPEVLPLSPSSVNNIENEEVWEDIINEIKNNLNKILYYKLLNLTPENFEIYMSTFFKEFFKSNSIHWCGGPGDKGLDISTRPKYKISYRLDKTKDAQGKYIKKLQKFTFHAQTKAGKINQPCNMIREQSIRLFGTDAQLINKSNLGFFITTGTFSSKAKEYAQDKYPQNLELWDINKLILEIIKLKFSLIHYTINFINSKQNQEFLILNPKEWEY
jgi:restriction endonuclease Mrr